MESPLVGSETLAPPQNGGPDVFTEIRDLIAEGEFEQAKANLVAELTDSTIRQHSETIYQLVVLLFEHFTIVELAQIRYGLNQLLTLIAPTQQIDLLQMYVNRREGTIDTNDMDLLLDHFSDLMFFAAEAIAIAKELQLDVKRKAHHIASKLILKFIKRLYVDGRFFVDSLEKLVFRRI